MFCYLRIHGIECTYDDLLKGQPLPQSGIKYTAKTLAGIAAKYGMKLRVVSMSMQELEHAEMPLPAYMLSSTTEDGTFALLTSVTARKVFYVDGATGAISTMSTEDFRRVWSGIGLARSDDLVWRFCSTTAVGVIVGLGLGLTTRMTKYLRKKPCL